MRFGESLPVKDFSKKLSGRTDCNGSNLHILLTGAMRFGDGNVSLQTDLDGSLLLTTPLQHSANKDCLLSVI
jgi:hypothetical protein